ncbi:TPA: hypothetical protein DEP34_01860 [Candidatus Uhrbacteria bacterium]|uniref:Phosphoglycerate mutase n=2 Tax=Candidatus Uhriibacteriota TaxID=1752732 RepID=A0A0G1T8E7_9BACT|nr:MAG: Phosphoglycerate mutase [Candidatus Uhrbacteria bacterium GW2011_GWF2_46_218]KKU41670.1 MAG: Phosphoglycerate mutase [Candidatus Uhrbacteria bacterium GW2011_GWE2_46_68]HBK33460.1 hypothetical protein [Candidatus Uhrbacteria bacterium]HCB19113.1 hypothetical protein [Candidatus Uhrbacteria bacterium]
MKFHLVLSRHTQTHWNAQCRYSGQADVPLDDTGILQADDLGEKLSSHSLLFIYSSDLIRAVSTAQAIAKKQKLRIQVRTDMRLREVHAGEITGLTKTDADLRFPAPHFSTHHTEFDFRSIGGESALQVRGRLHDFFHDLASTHHDLVMTGPHILLMGHGSAFRHFLTHHGHVWNLPQGGFQIVTLDFPLRKEL